MATQAKNSKLDILTEKIMRGANMAVRKLVETSAANNKNLIVGDKNGNPVSVPAKELLKKLASPKSSPKERT